MRKFKGALFDSYEGAWQTLTNYIYDGKYRPIMKIIIGSDHAGFMLKDQIKKYLADKKINVIDKGSFNEASVDYPDYAALVAKEVQASGQIGILFCGTGLGVAMAANKFKGIRAAPCR